MSKLVELCNKISLDLGSDPSLERALVIELAKIISACNVNSMNSDEGFCYKFNLPMVQVGKLPKMMNITEKEIADAFSADWGADAMKNHMYKDIYYQTLLLIVLYGIKYDKPNLTQMALLIIMFKLWNGRKTTFLKWCDPDVMKYVVSHMCTKRHLFAKHDDPFSLLKNYFVPTLLSKYSSGIKQTPSSTLQKLFSQSWGRLHQLWVSSKKEDMVTGKNMAQGGILPLYMKAKQDGLSITSGSLGKMDDEDGPSFGEKTSTSNKDEIITSVAEYITMHPNPKYPVQFLNQVNTDTKVSLKVIETLLKNMHNHTFHDLIHDILSVIFTITNVSTQDQICSNTFFDTIKKKVMGSKNNEDAKRLQVLCGKLLGDIFKTNFKLNYSTYSNVQQIQLRKVIIFGLYYNIRRSICRL